MPGLVPGIHVLGFRHAKDVDGRDEPGHDGKHHPAHKLVVRYIPLHSASVLLFVATRSQLALLQAMPERCDGGRGRRTAAIPGGAGHHMAAARCRARHRGYRARIAFSR
ncbi:MAG: hypothetical protein E6Q28_04210 [Afipia sp.]|nr:MAG: hypothetical protein E6Q28_04210 [Afipia sp.]